MQNLKCKIKKIITSPGNYISYKFTFCNLIVRLCSLQAFAICNIINFSDITDKHYFVSTDWMVFTIEKCCTNRHSNKRFMEKKVLIEKENYLYFNRLNSYL